VQEAMYEKEIVFENDFFYATRDSYPVTKLHTLIIPKRHFQSYFDMNIDEINSINSILNNQKNEIKKLDSEVTAFNIGINDGKDAGQSIYHLHVHLIPRRKGDIENPRGGVRGVIPAKQKYIKKQELEK
jgi:diadenosine tetraphosphate (Ap4A) HIT family hydrolase|tara:strand:+ start:822 stop:1208 length:387 start_codon:yes stop_codon:yes gene_type:complete